MRIGILTDNFSKLNRITRKLKNAEFNLKHLRKIPEFDHEIILLRSNVKISDSKRSTRKLEILELKIRCAFYQKD